MILSSSRHFITSSNIGSFVHAGSTRDYNGTAEESVLYGAASPQLILDNFCWLSTHIWEPITSSENNLGFPLGIDWSDVNNGAYNRSFIGDFFSSLRPTYLNTILNKRNGPYGHPTWKQIRNSDHPLLKWQNRNCVVPFLEPSEEKKIVKDSVVYTVKPMKSDIHSNFVEPIVSRKGAVLVHAFGDSNSGDLVLIKSSFGNNLVTFSNKSLEIKAGTQVSCGNNAEAYIALYNAYSGKKPGSVLKDQLQFMLHKEQIYPQDSLSYLNLTRNRPKYYVNFWRSSRGQRSVSNTVNSQGYSVSQSMWALDGRDGFSSANIITGGLGYEGELQNNYTTFFNTGTFDPNMMGNVNPSVVSFNTGSDLAATSYYKLVDSINASGTWDALIGTDDSRHYQKFSISAWINFTSSFQLTTKIPARQTIVSFIQTGGGQYIPRAFYLTSGSTSSTRRLAFSASYNAAPHAGDSNEWCSIKTSDGGTELTENTWHHVVSTFDPEVVAEANRAKLYLNGVQLSTYPPTLSDTMYNLKPLPFNFSDGMSVMTIGSGALILNTEWGAAGLPLISPFMGKMSDVAIYTGSLSLAQVQEIFNGGAPRSLWELSTKNQLISWWRMGGGAGLVTGSTPYTIGYVSPSQEHTGYALVASDGVSGAVGPINSAISASWDKKNTIFDMAGRNHAHAVASMKTTQLVSVHTLTGAAEAVRQNLDSNLKIGAMYARREPEYNNTPWPNLQISSSQGIRYVRVTGSRVFAGDSEWLAGAQKGLNPSYDSYDDFSRDIRSVASDSGIIPEFRISEHMETYLDEKGGNFFADHDGFLTLTGSYFEDSSVNGFYSTYSHTDFLKYFDILIEDHKGIVNPTFFKMRCNATLKFLPYDGFYPVQRTLQLATLFSQSYGDYVKSRGWTSNCNSGWRAFLTPFFAPGILYNSIKSGLAVDYPVYTDECPKTLEDYTYVPGGRDFSEGGFEHWDAAGYSVASRGIYGWSLSSSAHQWLADTVRDYMTSYTTSRPWDLTTSSYHNNSYDLTPSARDSSASWATHLATPFSARIPFEGLVEPENYLANKMIWDMEPDYSASLRQIFNDPTTNQAAFWGGAGKVNYKLAMHNFLAMVPKMFLNGGKFSTFASKPFPPNGISINTKESNCYYGMDVVVGIGQCNSLTEFRQRTELPEFSGITNMFSSASLEELDELKGVHTKMYSRPAAFGPPWVSPSSIFTSSQTSLTYHGSHMPFTPAYQDGFGSARILFYPYKGAGNYTFDEIKSALTMSYLRLPEVAAGTSAAFRIDNYLTWMNAGLLDKEISKQPNRAESWLPTVGDYYVKLISGSSNWQQLSSSINLTVGVNVKNVSYEKGVLKEFVPVSYKDDPVNTNVVWLIQPKWEAPILNFINSTTSSVVSGQGSGSIVRGMWHQTGNFCTGNEGVWMGIMDLPSVTLSSSTLIGSSSWDSEQHGDVFSGQKESVVREGRSNAYCDLFMRAPPPASTYLVIDGVQLTEGVDWTRDWTSSENTARSIINAINSSVSRTSMASSNCGTQLRHRITASLFFPLATETPFYGATYNNTGYGEVGIKIKVNDCRTTSSYSPAALNCFMFCPPGSVPTSDLLAVNLDYPNYYAGGALGNYISASIMNPFTVGTDMYWLLSGQDGSGTEKTGYGTLFKEGTNSEQKEIKSLADLVGFPKIKKRLGEVSDNFSFKEAIVAIPFVENSGEKRFFKLSRRSVEIALGNVNPDSKEVVGDSVKKTVLALNNYVLPPKFDFINNKNIDPFVAYVFEFSVNFTKEDLANIWQNLPPKLAQSFEQRETIVSHPLLVEELLTPDAFKKVRWMVFKVKQKAAKSYYDVTADSKDDSRFYFEQFKETNGIPTYSYNWPYDYCSIVELAKIGAEATFTKESAINNTMTKHMSEVVSEKTYSSKVTVNNSTDNLEEKGITTTDNIVPTYSPKGASQGATPSSYAQGTSVITPATVTDQPLLEQMRNIKPGTFIDGRYTPAYSSGPMGPKKKVGP